jgi:hypothetical protein
MRIRDLVWRGVAVWPPEWWPPKHAVMIDINSVLKEVGIQDIRHRYIRVEIETPQGPLWGGILLENPGHLDILYQKLKENIGRPLTEIGDQEIDMFPSVRKRGPKQVRPYQAPPNMRRESNTK